MKVIIFILMGLFALKIVWNLFIPYSMARELYLSPTGKTAGVTILPFVEVGFLLLVVLFLWIADEATRPIAPKQAAILGAAVIVASYIHFFVAGMLAGWIVSLLNKRKE